MAGSPFPRGPRHSLCSRRRRPEGRRAGGRAHTALGRAHVVNQMHHKWGTGWPGDGTHPVLCKDKGHLLLGRLPPQMTGALCTPTPRARGRRGGGAPSPLQTMGARPAPLSGSLRKSGKALSLPRGGCVRSQLLEPLPVLPRGRCPLDTRAALRRVPGAEAGSGVPEGGPDLSDLSLGLRSPPTHRDVRASRAFGAKPLPGSEGPMGLPLPPPWAAHAAAGGRGATSNLFIGKAPEKDPAPGSRLPQRLQTAQLRSF